MGRKNVGPLTVVILVLVFYCGNCNIQQFQVAMSYNAHIRVEDSESVLHRDSRSVHRSRRSVLNLTEQQEALDTHNRLRREEGGSNMELMIWDGGLADTAERSAQSCIWNHSNYGQNLYSTTDDKAINLTAAIEAWYYREKPYYVDYVNTGICKAPDGQCLHYTQVVWGASRKLGCAYKRCDTLYLKGDKNALLLVCNYDPPGNVKGEKPYKIGSGCSQCPSGKWWCVKGLCEENCSTSVPTCGCAPVCLNFGSVNKEKCSCSCSPGWTGVDCSLECKNFDSKCDPQPGQEGYLPRFCSQSDYTGTVTREQCPKMCKLCQAVGDNSTSTKPSLLNILSVWLSWLLIYSLRSI